MDDMNNPTISASPAAPSKLAFGQFVQTKRRDAGLTQRELAERVFVTESAVSKWERGVSFPDISLVSTLASALGVTEGELITASDDDRSDVVELQARSYRRWRAAVLWSTTVAYGLTVLATCIVNLSVQHTLSWFWVVSSAVATSFSVTTLPLLVRRHRGWITLGAFLLALFALLGTVTLLYGGAFLGITMTSILFATVILVAPVLLARASLPPVLRAHRAILALAIDSLALLVFLPVLLAQTGGLGALVPIAWPIALLGLGFAWSIALVVRYLPAPALVRAALTIALVGAFTWICNPIIESITSGDPIRWHAVDLSTWTLDTISGNIATIILIACLTVALVLTLTHVIRRARTGS